MKILTEIQLLLAAQKAILQEHFGMRCLAIFGSYARGEATPLSDVDISVYLERPIGWEIVDLHDCLETILRVQVDLVTEDALLRKPLLWEGYRRTWSISKRDARLFLADMPTVLEEE